MIKDCGSYLQGILSEIERVKAKGGTGIYRANARISNQVAYYIQAYFQKDPEYAVEIKKCRSCKCTWDIIIYFKKL